MLSASTRSVCPCVRVCWPLSRFWCRAVARCDQVGAACMCLAGMPRCVFWMMAAMLALIAATLAFVAAQLSFMAAALARIAACRIAAGAGAGERDSHAPPDPPRTLPPIGPCTCYAISGPGIGFYGLAMRCPCADIGSYVSAARCPAPL
eukprot:1472053-Rhodomonas_salina.2